MSEINKHWVYRKANRPKLWAILIVLLIVSLIPEFFIHHHPHFAEEVTRIDTTWGFFAWYGFLSCVAIMVCAKLLGIFLKRKDTYYNG